MRRAALVFVAATALAVCVSSAQAAPYIAHVRACHWPDGKRTRTITRHRRQALVVENDDRARHRLRQTLGPRIALSAWLLRTHEQVTVFFRVNGTFRFATCAGRLRLTVRVH
jgi:hypothetical protein